MIFADGFLVIPLRIWCSVDSLHFISSAKVSILVLVLSFQCRNQAIELLKFLVIDFKLLVGIRA